MHSICHPKYNEKVFCWNSNIYLVICLCPKLPPCVQNCPMYRIAPPPIWCLMQVYQMTAFKDYGLWLVLGRITEWLNYFLNIHIHMSRVKKKHIFGRQNLFVLHLCSNTGHLRIFNTKAAPYKVIFIILAWILYYCVTYIYIYIYIRAYIRGGQHGWAVAQPSDP